MTSPQPMNGATRSLLLLFLTFVFMISPTSGMFRSSQCVQIGQLTTLPPPRPAKQGKAYTIGGKLFEIKDSAALERPILMVKSAAADSMFLYGKESRGCKNDGYKLNPAMVDTYAQDYCPTDVEIRAYLVRQHGRVLRGWLHFEVEIKGDEMEYIYVQIRDEAFNAIGDFISDPKEQCNNSSVEELIQPSQYQYLPCSATGYREAKPSGAIFMAKRSQYIDKAKVEPYLPIGNLTKGIHFTWRLNEYWCNRHLRFRVDASVYSTKVRDIFYSTPQTTQSGCLKTEKKCPLKRKVTDYWIHPKWFGAADIKLEGELECSLPAVDYTTGKLAEEGKTWLKKTSEVTLLEDYLHPDNIETVDKGKRLVFESCQVDPGIANFSQIVTFGGRCKGLTSKEVGRTNFQGCDLKPHPLDPEDVDTSQFTSYKEYGQKLFQDRRRQCEQKCVEPDIHNEADLIEIKSYPRDDKRKFKVTWKTLRESRRGELNTTFWYSRKYHGSLCIFFTLFLLPVSNFVIRYYKETFMDSWCLGCPPYFWIHIFACFAIPTLYRSGYAAMAQVVDNFGSSTTKVGLFHRICGSIFIWLFVIMVVIGGIRPFAEGARVRWMVMHSATGYLLYLLALSLVISSSFIPASPTLKECGEDGFPTGMGFTVWATLMWLLIDVVFHLVLNYLQRGIDHKLDIRDRAGDGFILVPILPAVSMTDFMGSSIRKLALALYITLSCIITSSTLFYLWDKDLPEGCSMGELSCNLSEIRVGQEASPFGCSYRSLRYFKKICDIYECVEKYKPKL